MLEDFPIITQDRLAIRLKRASERMTRKEHPWVFEASITHRNERQAQASESLQESLLQLISE